MFEHKKYLSSSERADMAKLLNVTEQQVRIHFFVVLLLRLSSKGKKEARKSFSPLPVQKELSTGLLGCSSIFSRGEQRGRKGFLAEGKDSRKNCLNYITYVRTERGEDSGRKVAHRRGDVRAARVGWRADGRGGGAGTQTATRSSGSPSSHCVAGLANCTTTFGPSPCRPRGNNSSERRKRSALL